MNNLLTIKRPLIWMKRIRHRCGYGVHSPSAFDFVTNVIYEKTTYYAYEEIESSSIYKQLKKEATNAHRATKKNRFLFRLVNKLQPQTIVEIGQPAVSSLYMRAAKQHATYSIFDGEAQFRKNRLKQIDILYIQYGTPLTDIDKIVEQSLPLTGCNSAIVIEGIHYNAAMRKMWKQLEADERIITSFDLYHFGLMLFDKKKIKQQYIVNF